MRRIAIALVCSLVLAGGLPTGTGAAWASSRAARSDAPTPTSPGIQADGNLYVYEHAYWGGRWCANDGNENDYRFAYCSNNRLGLNYFNDIVSSVWNNGYYLPGLDSVIFHRDINYIGASMCITRGDYWADLSSFAHLWSDHIIPNDSISSHYWGALIGCGK